MTDTASTVVLPAELRDWVTLLKPRVVALVVFTGLVGVLLAPGGVNPVVGVAAVLCIAVAAGASGAINMWYERDIDALMRRTATRPIPDGRIIPGDALAFGIVLAVGSVLLMFLAANVVAAAILAISILFYTVIYTVWLKRRTAQNIVIGGAAGAFPPVIGWAAVTGNISLLSLLMFAIVFFWTPPHFWALSLFAHADYERAGVPMLPVVAGARTTRQCVMLYTLILVAVSMAPWVLGLSGPIYGAVAAILGFWFVVCAVRVLWDAQDELGRSLTRDGPARRLFRYSLTYLFILFAALAVDHWIW